MVTDPFRAAGSRNQTGPKVMRQRERKWYVDSSTGFNLGYTLIILGKNIRNTFQYHDMQWTTSYCNFNEHKRTKLESLLVFWVSLDCVCVLNKVVGLKYVLLTGHGSYLVLHPEHRCVALKQNSTFSQASWFSKDCRLRSTRRKCVMQCVIMLSHQIKHNLCVQWSTVRLISTTGF